MVNSDNISAKLLTLAKKHRMSTEDRKNVFCIIMSAEDYIDAFEKLLHLGIKDHKVIVSVLLHCCLSEKTYNPYYSTLAQKFCDFDRKYQLGFQYSSWDRIKDIESLKQFQVTNFAKFIAHLIMEGGQPLSILKVVEFGSLNKTTMKFVRQVLLTILLKDEETCKNVSWIIRIRGINFLIGSLYHFRCLQESLQVTNSTTSRTASSCSCSTS